MSKKKGMFAKSAKDILGNKPLTVSDFLDETDDNNIYSIPVNKIKDNPYQPRQIFNESKLGELANSIKKHGVIQPIIVRIKNDNILLVAGERRLRATKLAGIEKIPAIVSKSEPMEISLIENLQRENLNPFEEAEALQTMLNKYKYTQERLAETVGKSRPSIVKILSLNKIPDNLRGECSRVNIPRRTLFEIAQQKDENSMSVAIQRVIDFDWKAEDIRRERKKKREKTNQKYNNPDTVACNKLVTFKKYITKLDKIIDNEYFSTINELSTIGEEISKILHKISKL